jgi:anaerobic selenocysteine-containing dehydrogenase/Fe-S-cluster-containing dehydrogenase component
MDNHRHENPKVDSITKDFVPPRHWIGPEELDPSYWANSATREKRGQEFFEKPVEWLEKMDTVDKKGIARRDFLTIMGASMAMASFACARRPVHKIIPYVVKPEEITPGIPTWYASTCPECASSCGILVKNREGRPIKLEGNPDHPINQGSLCAQGQASLLNLYDPDRLKTPIMRSRSGGSQKEVSWDEVDAVLGSKLKAIASGSGRVRVLSGEMKSESTQRLIKEFLSAFRQGSHVEYEPLSLEEIAEAQNLSYGTGLIPHYRFDLADMVVSLGADFLGGWLSPQEYSRTWSTKRKLNGKDSVHARMSRMVCFESMMTNTGASADERYPIRPGDELKVALALVHELVVTQKKSNFAQDAHLASLLSGYKPEGVATEIGIPEGAQHLKRIALELWENRGRSLVVGGSLQTKTTHALGLQVAINLLNSILENEGRTVDGSNHTTALHSNFAGVNQLISEMKSGQVDALIVYRSNPAYYLPRAALGLEAAMKNVPLVIVVSDREDETGAYADYILPDHHYLENWGDSNPRKGTYSLQQPVLAPIHSTRAFQDMLLAWNKKAGFNTGSLISKAQDWHNYLQNHWKETLFRSSGAAGTFEQFWEGVLKKGAFITSSGNEKSNSRSFRAASFDFLPQYSPLDSSKISLALYNKNAMGDGRHANNAWLQELPDPISSVTWDNYLNVGPGLAKKFNLKNDDVVEVSSGDVSVHLPVYVQPGLHPQVVSVAVGYGRRSVGKVGNQVGVDVYPFVKVEGKKLVFSGSSVTIRKTGKFYQLASTQWHTATENRPIINDITLDEYRKNPAAANHTDPHLRLETVPTMWPEHDYKTYRWGMAIDLNSCFGCGACVIACQAENNVPVVGRDQVRVSRQMHWLRIDRYYSGNVESPDVIFQPMLCQHCENAPCETVCPVAATLHDDEGLNVQVYNRCVGTRYCQNNCPYKVRRFNFFDHWKSYEGTMNLIWNPDVTVRTRGIMEKCTFCIQRIRDAKDKAKDLAEKVRDGEIKTACQQTCPADSIIFGDLNNPESKVSKLSASQHAFRVLEITNTKPAISYMTKVRNKVLAQHGGHKNDRKGD